MTSASDIIETDNEMTLVKKLQSIIDNSEFRSGVIYIQRKDDVLITLSKGFTDLKHKAPIDKSTLFPVASITKMFTTAALLKCLYDFHASFSPDFIYNTIEEYIGFTQERWEGVRWNHLRSLTIHDLLSNLSGLECYTDAPNFYEDINCQLNAQPMDLIKASLEMPLGQKGQYLYSNTNFCLAALIVEEITGQAFKKYLEERMLKPLKLMHTFLGAGYRNQQPLQNYAVGLQLDADSLSGGNDWCLEIGYAGYGLISNAQDLAYWLHSLFNGKIIPKSLIDLMVQPNQGNYGYGLMVRRFGSSLTWYHDRSYDGVSSTARYLPEKDVSVVILSNINLDSQEFYQGLEEFQKQYPNISQDKMREEYFKAFPQVQHLYNKATVYDLADKICALF